MRPRFRPPSAEAKRRKAERNGMNDTEAAFCEHLSRRVGWYCAFEPETLTLAKGVKYTPDFRTCVDGVTTYYEVKGSKRTRPTKRFPLGNIVPIITEQAHVRFKVAAAMYPQCRFLLVHPNRGQWLERDYSAAPAERKGGERG